MDRPADVSFAAGMFEYHIAAIIQVLVQIQYMTKHLSTFSYW